MERRKAIRQTASRTNSIAFGNYSIGGAFGNQSAFFVDGVPNNGPANNVNGLIPSEDIVQEFKVVTNNVSAQYGNYAGGVVNVTTKSGTNAFHGTGYDYLRNKDLNANDYFASLADLPRAPLIQNQFGATVGRSDQGRTRHFSSSDLKGRGLTRPCSRPPRCPRRPKSAAISPP